MKEICVCVCMYVCITTDAKERKIGNLNHIMCGKNDDGTEYCGMKRMFLETP